MARQMNFGSRQSRDGGTNAPDCLFVAHITVRLVYPLKNGRNAGLNSASLALAEYRVQKKQRNHRIPAEVRQKAPCAGEELVLVRQKRQ